MTCKIYFEPRDIWVGVFWDKGASWTIGCARRYILSIYICVIPCLPVRLQMERTIH